MNIESPGFEFECYERDKLIKEDERYNGECLRNQATMEKAKRMIEREQERAMKTKDPKERAEIIKRLRDRIRKIVKCQRCHRIISSKIVVI